jgi:flagellar L-ring protein precursor FlgH
MITTKSISVRLVRRVLCAVVVLLAERCGTAMAQDASLLQVAPIGPKQKAPLTLENSSFMYRKLPPEAEQRELQINDIITVLVDYKSQLQSDGDANSKKTASFNAVLSDWLKFDGKNILPAPQAHGDPKIAGALTSQYKTDADMKQNDALTFKIACNVVDIRPNGNLVLDGRREVQIDDEVWEQAVTGVVRRQSIGPDRTVRIDDVADPRIRIRKKGFIHDATQRGWLTRWYDQVKPF